MDEILDWFETLPFGASTARMFGLLYGSLRSQGKEIGVMDTLIASVALEHNEVVISRNIKHFSRVPGLVTRSCG
jgi:predicted nucleic acid-binding protein